MTQADEAARAARTHLTDAEAIASAQHTYASVARICGAAVDRPEDMAQATVAEVTYGVPALAAALQALAARLAVVEAAKDGG